MEVNKLFIVIVNKLCLVIVKKLFLVIINKLCLVIVYKLFLVIVSKLCLVIVNKFFFFSYSRNKNIRRSRCFFLLSHDFTNHNGFIETYLRLICSLHSKNCANFIFFFFFCFLETSWQKSPSKVLPKRRSSRRERARKGCTQTFTKQN